MKTFIGLFITGWLLFAYFNLIQKDNKSKDTNVNRKAAADTSVNEKKEKNKLKNINGKTLILIGVLIPIILLLLFGESYSNPDYYKSYVEYLVAYLTSANLVFYDELQVPISNMLALALGIIGIGIYKLINKPED